MKRLVFRSVLEEETRLVALKRGEVDIAYSIRGALAEELQRTPGLTLKPNYPPGTFWLVFPEQWTDPKSPWADQRVRLAVNHSSTGRPSTRRRPWASPRSPGASSRPRSSSSGSRRSIRTTPPGPSACWPRPATRTASTPATTTATRRTRTWARPWSTTSRRAGIRTQLRALERAAFIAQNRDKKLKNIIQTASGAAGNAATRLDAFVAAGGTFTYGSYPDIEGLVREQAGENDAKRREATLQRIQQMIHEKAMFAPIWELAFLNGYGPRVAESGLTLIAGHPYSSPYEDVTLKGK